MKRLAVLIALLALGTPAAAAAPPPPLLAIVHATVIDMTGAGPMTDMTVVVTGDRITSVAKTGAARIPAGARVVDATGKYLIPGLWDMHVHVREADRSFSLFVANGVTGIRVMGGDFQNLFRWRDEVASGRRLGPRVVACGPVVDGPEPANPDHALPVATADEAREAVNFLKSSGADFVKAYDGLSRDAYFAVLAEASRLRMPVVGHIPDAVSASEASGAGLRSVEHLGGFLEESSEASDALRSRPAAKVENGDFSAIPARIAARGTRMLDTYSGARAERLLATLARNRTWQVPTLIVKKIQAYADEIPDDDRRFRYVPAAVRENWKPSRNFFLRYRTPEYVAFRKRLFFKEMEIVGAMRRAGVPLMAGSDLGGANTVAGFSLHDELALLVEAGLTPMEALQAATREPALFLGRADAGTIGVGKVADLVLLGANPLENIRNSERVDAVVVSGRYFPGTSLRLLLAAAAHSAAGQ